jgi:2-oxoglutarate ferredoxin oxidoreductase subunit delta
MDKPSRRGRILIQEEKCKGCELCTTVCPYNLIQMADHYNSKGYRPAMLVDPEGRCTGCTLCAMMCPDVAITVFRLVKKSSSMVAEITSSLQARAA